MEQVLAYTNALGNLQNGYEVVRQILEGKRVFISELTEMEKLCNPKKSREDRAKTQSLLDDCEILYFNARVKQMAIRVRLATGMKLVDSIIAATAILAGIPIVTSDEGFLRLGKLGTVIYYESPAKL